MSNWTEVSRKLLKILEDATKKEKDRLALCGAITDCNMVLARSVNGWISWLSDPRTMKLFSEKELKEVEREFNAVAQQFVKVDIKFTDKYGPKPKGKREAPNYIK